MTRRIFFVRHGLYNDATGDLTPEGLGEIDTMMGKIFHGTGVDLQRIFHATAQRTQQTAARIASNYFRLSGGREAPLVPSKWLDESTAQIIDIRKLRGLDDADGSICLVSHEGMIHGALQILTDRLVTVRHAHAYEVETGADSWRGTRKNRGKLVNTYTPV